mmetsp:Transcript_16909/g.27392  ORF Transcript_16909/g.27392 Transcript_16909/m.27392 type:complete len:219 (-) Transcript_16909:51-707(-)
MGVEENVGREECRAPYAALVETEQVDYLQTTYVSRFLSLEDRRGSVSWCMNFMWLVCGGGLVVAFVYALVGVVLCCTIVLAPFGKQLLKLASLALFPFGKHVHKRPCCCCGPEPGCSLCTFLGNLLWLPLGIALWCLHFAWGIISILTIIGIPFGFQHFKLMQFALRPFGTHDDKGLHVVENIATETVTQPVLHAVPIANDGSSAVFAPTINVVVQER